MKTKLVVLVLMLIGMTAGAVEFNPYEGPEPVAVLIETNPWAPVAGADTPRVVVYENGQLIYRKYDKNGAYVFLTKNLNNDQLADIREKLQSFGDYKDIDPYYVLTQNIMDLPESKIYLSLEEREFVTGVYGLVGSKEVQESRVAGENNRETPTIPDEIRSVNDYLKSLTFQDAVPWQPAHVEVMLWGYENAPDDSIQWPDRWPGLDSPYTVKRGDAYSIFLPGTELTAIKAFLQTRKERGAVEIDGKKWAVWVRETFPSEPVWKEALKSATLHK